MLKKKTQERGGAKREIKERKGERLLVPFFLSSLFTHLFFASFFSSPLAPSCLSRGLFSFFFFFLSLCLAYSSRGVFVPPPHRKTLERCPLPFSFLVLLTESGVFDRVEGDQVFLLFLSFCGVCQ